MLAEQYLETEETPPTPRIARYREALLQRWPDTELAASPWASGQTGDASGPVLSVQIQPGRAEEVAVYVADLADEHGLVCYDLQQDRLRP